jgi:hypothetical protein
MLSMNEKANWWSIKSRRWLWLAIILFLAFQVLMRTKFGSIFCLAFAWLLVHQWLVKRTLGEEFSDHPVEKIFVSLYYAFIISFAGFVLFFIMNAILRSINNDWRYFQPP